MLLSDVRHSFLMKKQRVHLTAQVGILVQNIEPVSIQTGADMDMGVGPPLLFPLHNPGILWVRGFLCMELFPELNSPLVKGKGEASKLPPVRGLEVTQQGYGTMAKFLICK